MIPTYPPSERSERNIAWIEEYCLIPEGRDVGKPVVLREWQRNILRGIYDGKTRRAVISFGRKNAKTALSAMLNLLHLCGPEARPNSQLYSAAQSRDQAAILFNLAAKMVRMSEVLSEYVLVRESAKELLCAEIGAKYKALSAEAKTAYGLSPVFSVHDELGQVRGPRSELYEAIETASAAQTDPITIVISTQAPNADDLLSVLIDNAKTNTDGRTKLFLYEADTKADPFAEETIRQANPAFGDFQNATEVMGQANDAREMPSREAEFRNLILNQRVEVHSPYVSRSIWEKNGGPALDLDGPVYAGLDLSATSDLTAFVMAGQTGEATSIKPTFWLPREGLEAKARQDRVPYDQWAKEGLLETTPGNTVDYEFVATFLWRVCQEYDIRKIAFDRWNLRNFKPWLLRAGFTEDEIEELFVPFGQGFQSMSPALRDLDELLLNGRARHGMHPVLTMCAQNSVTKSDPAGNRKLIKLGEKRRIDGMVALAMAVSVMAEADESGPSVYEERGLLVV
ncbi:terminase large subunit [Dinoroseobacter sp. S124A]|uniref:terminase large subunit n=1 Tax=Dinoroseobacter sp. S124A TaxID=3415128 RepID=UPI003C7E24AA